LKKRKHNNGASDGGDGMRRSIFLGGTSVLWQGRSRVTVEGAEKIAFLSPERILVLLGRECLSVQGDRLMCLSFQDKVLVIGGRIDSLAYEETKV
jgi:hypothetical protein